MARDNDGIILIKYANSGDAGLGGLDLDELWPISYSTPGGPFPQRIQFNQLFRNLSALAVEINEDGPYLDYNATIDYSIGVSVTGSDGLVYESLVANGPSSSVVNPVGDSSGTWRNRNRPLSLIKTASYSVSKDDESKQIILGSANSGNKVFTLPSVGSADDGMWFEFYNDSNWQMTLSPSDSDSVGPNGPGYGMVALDRGCAAKLKYNHSDTNWTTELSGGTWMIEGLKLFAPLTEMTAIDPSDLTKGIAKDESGRHGIQSINDTSVNFSAANASRASNFLFNGIDENLTSADSTDWDVFADRNVDYTLFARARFDTVAAATETFLAHYQDANNRWVLRRSGAGQLWLRFQVGGVDQITMAGGTIVQNTWHDLAFIRIGSNSGLYIDGAQVAFDNVWNQGNFTASLTVGMEPGVYFPGRMNDVLIVEGNPFSASPNSGITDTINIPRNLNPITGGVK